MKAFYLLFLMGIGVLQAQNPTNARQFMPYPINPPNNAHTASGAPGADYWQNAASYSIKTAINPQDHSLTGTQTITYTNNSPDELAFLWLYLEQNLFRLDSRGNTRNGGNGRFRGAFANGGVTLSKVEILHNGERYTPQYYIDDTRMKLNLKSGLAKKGGVVQIMIDWKFIIPQYGADRMGRFAAGQGTVYELAQWYPKMAVYDAVNGWNHLPYLGQGEFYLEYGNFDVEITAPSDMVVVASGALQNPQEVFTPEQFRRYTDAKKTEKTTFIITKEEVGTAASRPQGRATLTWKYRSENVRDVAWAASKSFILDAAGWNNVMLMSAYPREGVGTRTNPGWEKSTEYLVHSVKHYSKKWLEYPYPVMINVAGVVGGMEYPMVIFCDVNSRGKDLFDVTDHEFGHIWFPMIVGQDERRFAWMDEGFNTFINYYSSVELYGVENTSGFGGLTAEMITMLSGGVEQPIQTYADYTRSETLGFNAYYKPGYGLRLLRDYILGEERFDEAFRTYINRWKYKHPMPEDFFRTIENVAGEDLDYFWRGWFYNVERFDQAISNVQTSGNITTVSLQNKGGLILPTVIEIAFTDGTKMRTKLNAEVWSGGNTFSTPLKTDGKAIRHVKIDPDGLTPDIDKSNNIK
jgi:Peptidase family M1 domain